MNFPEYIHPVAEPELENSRHGIIFAVTAIPTQGADGQQGIGAIGETWFADALGEITHREVLGFGKAMRELADRQAGHHLNDNEFETWRGNLASSGTVDFEYQVDRTLWSLAQRGANEAGSAVVAGKAVSFLRNTLLETTRKPLVIAVGVSLDDQVATLRKWRREHKGMVSNPTLVQLEESAISRYKRLKDEQQNFVHAYPNVIPHYSRETTLETVHYLFDNSPEITYEDMKALALIFTYKLFWDIKTLSPALVRMLSPLEDLQEKALG